MGVSRQAVSRWESDAAQLTFDNLQILCAVLKVSITYFADIGSGTEETPPEPVLLASGSPVAEKEAEALSEERSVSDAAALKAEKRRKRIRRALLVGIIFVGILLVAGISVTIAIGISVFSPNTGYASVNSYSLKPEVFVYFLLAIFVVIIIELVLIFIFYKSKKV